MLPGLGSTSLPTRAEPSPLAAARQALALSSQCHSLPCREEEKAIIRRFIGAVVSEEGELSGHTCRLRTPLPAPRLWRSHHRFWNPIGRTCSEQLRSSERFHKDGRTNLKNCL